MAPPVKGATRMDEQKNNFCPDMPEQAGEPGSPDMEKQKAVKMIKKE